MQELDDKIEVLNDEKRKEVIVTFRRESNQGSVRVTEQPRTMITTVTIFETVVQMCVEGRFYEKPYILCHFSVIVTRNIYFSFNAGHLQGDQSISLNSMISSIENRMPSISEFQLWWK